MSAIIIKFSEIQCAHLKATRHLPAEQRADEMQELYDRLEASWRAGCLASVARQMHDDGVAS